MTTWTVVFFELCSFLFSRLTALFKWIIPTILLQVMTTNNGKMLPQWFLIILLFLLFIQHLVSLIIVKASSQCIRMSPINGNATCASVKSKSLEINNMMVQMPMMVYETLNDWSVFVHLIEIKLLSHSSDSIRLEQEVVCNALSVQNLRGLQEIVVI